MPKNLFSIAEVSRRLSIPEYKINYAHRTRRLADSSFRIAGKRIYTSEDLDRIAEYFGVKLISGDADEAAIHNPTPPFECKSNNGDGHVITDADGLIVAWVRGAALAERIISLINNDEAIIRTVDGGAAMPMTKEACAN